MKKLKLIPAVLMLVLSFAILGVGIYAASPTNNTISGTVTVIASNAQVQIDAYLGTTLTSQYALLSSSILTRTGDTVDLDSNNLDIEFPSDEADSYDDVDPIVITFVITNKSTQNLGVYFSADGNITTQLADVAGGAGASKILTTGTKLNGTNHRTSATVNNAVDVEYTGYTQLAGTLNTSIQMTMTMTLPALYEDQIDISLATNSIHLYVENYDSTMDPNYVEAYDITFSYSGNSSPSKFNTDMSISIDGGEYVAFNSSSYANNKIPGISSIRFRCTVQSSANSQYSVTIGGTVLSFSGSNGKYFSELYTLTRDVTCVLYWHNPADDN